MRWPGAAAGALGVALAACAGRGAPAPNSTPAPRPAPGSPAAFRAAADSVLGDPKWASAVWGAVVVDARTGDTLYTRNAGKLFLPASNQKVITGAVALARLGPDYRWRTVLAAGRPGPDGTLAGNVYVFGSGDPTVSDAMRPEGALGALGGLADSLRARGVRRVAGEVVAVAGGAGGRFPEGPWKFGWEWDDFDTPSGAGVTELLFNDGVARVTVYGGARAGDPARLAVRPTERALPFSVSTDDLRTVARGDTAGVGITAAWDYATNAYVLEAAVPAGDSTSVDLGIHDPRAAYAGALSLALQARGVPVRGSSVTRGAFAGGTSLVRGDYPGGRLDTLAVLTSPPLRDVLPALEKPSQNQIAEALFLTLGREGTGVGAGDSARRIVGEQLRLWGVEPERDAAVRDGSGLSRHDYVTPAAMVRVLRAARALPAGQLFYDALPVAGVDGTLRARMRGTAAQGRVRAKTGSIDRVRSLSGYAATADGGELVFSLLCNNFTTPAAEVTRAMDAIAVRMAELRLGAPGGAGAASGGASR